MKSLINLTRAVLVIIVLHAKNLGATVSFHIIYVEYDVAVDQIDEPVIVKSKVLSSVGRITKTLRMEV